MGQSYLSVDSLPTATLIPPKAHQKIGHPSLHCIANNYGHDEWRSLPFLSIRPEKSPLHLSFSPATFQLLPAIHQPFLCHQAPACFLWENHLAKGRGKIIFFHPSFFIFLFSLGKQNNNNPKMVTSTSKSIWYLFFLDNQSADFYRCAEAYRLPPASLLQQQPVLLRPQKEAVRAGRGSFPSPSGHPLVGCSASIFLAKGKR